MEIKKHALYYIEGDESIIVKVLSIDHYIDNRITHLSSVIKATYFNNIVNEFEIIYLVKEEFLRFFKQLIDYKKLYCEDQSNVKDDK